MQRLSVYRPLLDSLAAHRRDTLTLPLDRIEALIGEPLPSSLRTRTAT